MEDTRPEIPDEKSLKNEYSSGAISSPLAFFSAILSALALSLSSFEAPEHLISTKISLASVFVMTALLTTPFSISTVYFTVSIWLQPALPLQSMPPCVLPERLAEMGMVWTLVSEEIVLAETSL